jgi:hypothetical protein
MMKSSSDTETLDPKSPPQPAPTPPLARTPPAPERASASSGFGETQVRATISEPAIGFLPRRTASYRKTGESQAIPVTSTKEHHLISLYLDTPLSLFNTIDPSPLRERDLSDEVDAYIRSAAQSADQAAGTRPYLLKVVLPPGQPEGLEALMGRAVSEHYSLQAAMLRIERWNLVVNGLWQFLFGTLFLVVCQVISTTSKSWLKSQLGQSVIAEGVGILGFIVWAKPWESFLFNVWPVTKMMNRLRRLSIATVVVEFRELGTEKTLVEALRKMKAEALKRRLDDGAAAETTAEGLDPARSPQLNTAMSLLKSLKVWGRRKVSSDSSLAASASSSSSSSPGWSSSGSTATNSADQRNNPLLRRHSDSTMSSKSVNSDWETIREKQLKRKRKRRLAKPASLQDKNKKPINQK